MTAIPDSPPKMPRWVKVAGIIVLVLILGFIILKAAGIGGEHGPSRHASASNTDNSTTPTSGTETATTSRLPTETNEPTSPWRSS